MKNNSKNNVQNVMISIKNVNKNFGKKQVLNEISLDIEKGEIVGLIGHNGSGKTVLLKCITGLLYFDGEIIVNNLKMHKDTDIIKNAGVIIEEPTFLANYSGFRNLDYLYRIRNKKNYRRVFEAMEKVGLNPGLRLKVKNYSLGMKQRLALAQAIMEQPDILILDEPMNGLDKDGMAEMRKFFLQLKTEGKTIVMASHNKDDIDILCDHVYEMNKGCMEKIR